MAGGNWKEWWPFNSSFSWLWPPVALLYPGGILLTYSLCAHPTGMSHATSHGHTCFESWPHPTHAHPALFPAAPTSMPHMHTLWGLRTKPPCSSTCGAMFPRVLMHAHTSTPGCTHVSSIHTSILMCTRTQPHFSVHTSMRPPKSVFLSLYPRSPCPLTHICTTPGNACTRPVSASTTLAPGPADLDQAGL